jgi:hypothetical protein
MNSPYAESINYWQTSATSPDTWIEKTKKLLKDMGGNVLVDAYGSDAQSGTSAFMLAFEIGGQQFKITWPVLKSKTHNERSARIQAATLLYHDVKARALSSTVLGAKAAFFTYLMLPDGRTAAAASFAELEQGIPALFRLVDPQLSDGNIIEGEVRGD